MSGKGKWFVILRCTIIKQVHCEDCTEEEAAEEPFERADDEMEVEQVDWEVIEVKKDTTA